MLSRNYVEVAAEPAGEGITIRWVIGKPEGAPNFATRVIEFQPGAVFDTHQHPFEHEIFVLEGEGVAEGPKGKAVMRPGGALYIPPDEPHGYRNTGEGVLRFICVIPHPPAATDQVAELETRITDLKARLPKHSIPPAMLTELDDLEEELAQARAKIAQENKQ
jgi:quercetin dioxygenase-like cupin family protein